MTTHAGPLSEDFLEREEKSEAFYDGVGLPFDDGSTGESCSALPGFGIVGGRAASLGDLTYFSTAHIYPAGCTATLIGPRQLVTAAHCVKNILDNVEIKPKARFGLNRDKPDFEAEIASIIAHPAFGRSASKEGQLFDIALVVLKADVEAPFQAVAVGFPQELNLGREVVLAGYGRYFENDTQRRPLTWVKTEVEQLIEPWAEIQLTRNTEKGGCYGDSGGPTFIVQPQTKCLRVVGVTHGPPREGDGTCDRGGETVMNLSKYRGWLNCGFQALEAPLSGFEDDGSEVYCSQNQILNF